ncbi:MAG: SDR family oxidoreductase [Chlamydiota bacterium]
MRILLTGANGYIGCRLAALLVKKGYDVTALVREPRRLHLPKATLSKIHVIKADLLQKKTLRAIPKNIDVAYYFIHSMTTPKDDFCRLDRIAAENFVQRIDQTSCKQIIYLSGIQDTIEGSKHLASREEMEHVLQKAKASLTTLRAAIIIGSGSASFEIMRDLVEKLPIMIAPKWIKSVCQPIAIRDVLYYLEGVVDKPACFNQTFDIGGPDILSYRKLLLEMARLRGLKRWIIQLPVLTPRLSSYWLYLITSTNYYLASALVEGLKNDVVCQNNHIKKILPKKCLSYREALEKAFDKIEQVGVLSSWTDALSSGRMRPGFLEHVHPPKEGCVQMRFTRSFTKNPEQVYACFMDIGGKRGWYYMNWAWTIRGMIDELIGGVGIRRGRASRKKLRIGDALDFWRVLLIDEKERRLLLYAEMKLPGEAWLEFAIHKKGKTFYLQQSAIFRPLGILGRLYWYALYVPHYFLLKGLLKQVIQRSSHYPKE